MNKNEKGTSIYFSTHDWGHAVLERLKMLFFAIFDFVIGLKCKEKWTDRELDIMTERHMVRQGDRVTEWQRGREYREAERTERTERTER
jgi:hypothetical protein